MKIHSKILDHPKKLPKFLVQPVLPRSAFELWYISVYGEISCLKHREYFAELHKNGKPKCFDYDYLSDAKKKVKFIINV